MMKEIENIGEAIKNFNIPYTNKEKNAQTTYETLCKDLGLLRDIANITLQDMAYGLKVTEQTIRNFEKGTCNNTMIMLYYYYKLIVVFGVDTMDIITKQVDEYFTLSFKNVYTDYKELTNN